MPGSQRLRVRAGSVGRWGVTWVALGLLGYLHEWLTPEGQLFRSVSDCVLEQQVTVSIPREPQQPFMASGFPPVALDVGPPELYSTFWWPEP